MSRLYRPILCIPLGDPAGIGAEIAVKALMRKDIYALCRPVLVGSRPVVRDAVNFIPADLEIRPVGAPEDARGEWGGIDLIDLANVDLKDYTYGAASAAGGRAAAAYIERAADYAARGAADAVVCGPVHGMSLRMAGNAGTDEVQIVSGKEGGGFFPQLLVRSETKIAQVSGSVDLRLACESVTTEHILFTIASSCEVLCSFGISDPAIGVAGFNPRSGGGLLGREEREEILPAIGLARARGYRVDGPVSPENLFPRVRGGMYDLGIAMYHDQGRIPLKAEARYTRKTDAWSDLRGACVTLGLPFVMTSVIHGAAFDRAGEGCAGEESMVDAVKTAVRLLRGKGSRANVKSGPDVNAGP